jgi:hypothetical protein
MNKLSFNCSVPGGTTNSFWAFSEQKLQISSKIIVFFIIIANVLVLQRVWD